MVEHTSPPRCTSKDSITGNIPAASLWASSVIKPQKHLVPLVSMLKSTGSRFASSLQQEANKVGGATLAHLMISVTITTDWKC